MKQEEGYYLKARLSNFQCYNERSMQELASFADQIRSVIRYINSKTPPDMLPLQLSEEQLVESELHLQSWINHPTKRSMSANFKEYKSDFLSILEDYLRRGDEHNLWEDSAQ